MYKRFVVLVMTVIILFGLPGNVIAKSTTARDDIDTLDSWISSSKNTMAFNSEFSNRVGNCSIDLEKWAESFLTIDSIIAKDYVNVELSLSSIEHTYSGVSKAVLRYIDDEKHVYIAAASGFFTIDNQEYVEDDSLAYSIDYVSVNDSIFAVLTIGSAFENNVPKVLFYGIYSQDIEQAYKAYILSLENESSCQPLLTNNRKGLFRPTYGYRSYDSSLIYGNKITLSASGYTLGYISLFHQAQVERGGDGNILGKVNSKSSNVVSYAQNVILTSGNDYVMWARPDEIDIRLSTTTSPDLVQVSSHVPLESHYTITLSALSYGPVYLPSIVINSTTITESNAQKRRWYMSRIDGWTDIDGGVSSDCGVYCEIFTHVNGGQNVYGSVNYTATVQGRLHYMYVYSSSLDNGTYIGSLWVGSINTGASHQYQVVDN